MKYTKKSASISKKMRFVVVVDPIRIFRFEEDEQCESKSNVTVMYVYVYLAVTLNLSGCLFCIMD